MYIYIYIVICIYIYNIIDICTYDSRVSISRPKTRDRIRDLQGPPTNSRFVQTLDRDVRNLSRKTPHPRHVGARYVQYVQARYN